MGLIGSIFFCTDCFNLDLDNDVPELQKMKDYLSLLEDRKFPFVYVGFADVRGGDKHNQILSEKRAKSVEGFVRNLLKDHRNYDVQPTDIKGHGKSFSQPDFLEGFRRVDIFGLPAVRPKQRVPDSESGPHKSRDWKARIIRSATITIPIGPGALKLLIVDQNPENLRTSKTIFEFVSLGVGVGPPSASFSSSDCIPFTTSFAIQLKDFAGIGTWITGSIQPGLGFAIDTLILGGPRDNADEEPVFLKFRSFGAGLTFSIGAGVFQGEFRIFDNEPTGADAVCV